MSKNRDPNSQVMCAVVDQPWASAAVFGGVEVINMPIEIAYRGELFICDKAESSIIGVVSISDCDTPDVCQLRGATGPWCWAIRYPQVFREPVSCTRKGRVFEYPYKEVAGQLLTAMGPQQARSWLWRKHQETLTREQVYPDKRPEPGGGTWRGD